MFSIRMFSDIRSPESDELHIYLLCQQVAWFRTEYVRRISSPVLVLSVEIDCFVHHLPLESVIVCEK